MSNSECSAAYTVVYHNSPHCNVGSTFRTKAQAYNDTQDRPDREIWKVVTWIEDFTEVNSGVLLFRTDGIHEVSYVVAEESTNMIETNQEAAVRTTIVDPK